MSQKKLYNPQNDVIEIIDGKRVPKRAYDLYASMHGGPRMTVLEKNNKLENQSNQEKNKSGEISSNPDIPPMYFKYDGKYLTYVERNGNEIKEQRLQAVSGRPNKDNSFSYDKFHQLNKDEGPIPEGVHEIDLNSIFKKQDRSRKDIIGTYSPALAKFYDPTLGKVVGKFFPRLRTAKIGRYPGGEFAWGEGRVDVNLEPEVAARTKRSGITIHGGSEPGSAGCIDLVHNDKEFFKILDRIPKKYQKIPLIVDYSNTPDKVWWEK